MATTPEEFMDATDSFLKGIEKSRLVNAKEMEAIRKEIVRDVKREAKDTAKSLQYAKVGSAKVLVPNASNLRKINLSSERVRSRFSSFRLSYLDRSQVANLTKDGSLPDDPRKFIRHSRRLARHAREFLTRIAEEEPTLQEEVDATLGELEDNDMDLLKLEVKSMTRMRETLVRAVNGRKERGQVIKEIDDWDLNRQLYNLSVLEHPAAVVRNLFAGASERMASATTTKVSEIAKRAHVMVALPPQAAATLRPNSRTADFVFGVFDTKTLNDRYKNLPATQGSAGSWRGLGLGYNTKEWYVPVPPAIVEGVAGLAEARRAAQLEAAREYAAATEITRPE